MAVEPLRIHADQKTDLNEVLAKATTAPVLVEKDGIVYRVSAEPEDLWSSYDPEAVRQALRRSAGAFTGTDAEQLKRELLAQREQDSRGRPA